MNTHRKSATVIATIFLFLITACQTSSQGSFESSVKKFHSKDRPQAVVEIKTLARNGNVNAQAYLGAMYASGDGVRRNLPLAVDWQKKAALGGHALAQYNLAVMYSRGLGAPQSLESAAEWFQVAANQGLPEARLHLGLFHEKGWVLRKCPYLASEQYYQAGHEFLEKGNLKGARKALASIRKILPKYYLVKKLSTEIYMYE